jgi:hypothetical protein
MVLNGLKTEEVIIEKQKLFKPADSNISCPLSYLKDIIYYPRFLCFHI